MRAIASALPDRAPSPPFTGRVPYLVERFDVNPEALGEMVSTIRDFFREAADAGWAIRVTWGG